MNLTEKLTLIFEENKIYTINQLISLLGIKPQDKSLLRHTLNGMDILFDNGKYGSYTAFGCVRGRLQSTKNDYNFVIPDDGSEDIFVPDENTLGAMHGDTVICRPFERKSDGDRRGNRAGKGAETKGGHKKGKVIKVLERANQTIVGQCVFQGNQVYVLPSNSRLKRPVLLSGKGTAKKLRPFELVSCNITSYTEKGPLQGELTEVLGLGWEKGVDLLSIIREHRLPDEFSDEALELATALEQKGVDARGREDLRHKLIFTMDGADAKDLDDAVSIEKYDGGWILGVHIADVSHYVRPDSILDAEARKRGTSVYFPGKVLPMLPEQLSNGICSLSPNADRLCLSVEMRIDQSGETLESRIFQSVIRSKYRLTYEAAAAMTDGQTDSCDQLVSTLTEARELARVLEKRRYTRGALDFELPEPYFTLDEDGRVTNVQARERLVTHRMIEQFMLAANTAVAKFMRDNSLPALYRVHEEPDAVKLEELDELIKPLGYRIQTERITPLSCAALLKDVKGSERERLISTLLLRSMKKARYCAQDIGHFGLAEENYLHFTSPIRRYPDLIVHRMIHFYFEGNQKGLEIYRKNMDGLAKHTSDREIAAAEAERDADDMKKAEYAQGLIGESFEGVISGMNQSVMWVELANTLECVIPRQNMDDSYSFDPNRMTLLGRHNRAILSMGDTVSITIVDADPAERRIEAKLARSRSKDGAANKDRRTDRSEQSKSGVKGAKRRRKASKRKARSKR